MKVELLAPAGSYEVWRLHLKPVDAVDDGRSEIWSPWTPTIWIRNS